VNNEIRTVVLCGLANQIVKLPIEPMVQTLRKHDHVPKGMTDDEIKKEITGALESARMALKGVVLADMMND